MCRAIFGVAVVLGSLLVGCGGLSPSTGGTSGSGGGTPPSPPVLSAIVPSTALVGNPYAYLLAYGSNFQPNTTIRWNGTSLKSTCVGTDMGITGCDVAVALSAAIPTSDLATAGTAKITLSTPNALGTAVATSSTLTLSVVAAPAASTWVRSVAGISAPNAGVWDAARGKLYVSVGSSDPANPNTIAVIDPVAGSITQLVPAATNPNKLSISSDSGYLWAGLDGSYSVQRYLLPSFSPDVSFALPTDPSNKPQSAVSLEAAPVNAHTLCVVPGDVDWDDQGDGVYVYDDATPRPNHTAGYNNNGTTSFINWIQWGADDTTIYGTSGGPLAVMSVNASGVTVTKAEDIYGGPEISQYDRSNGLLYSGSGSWDPVQGTLMGVFNTPADLGCTADSSLGRYYCIQASFLGGTDVMDYYLQIFDLKSYALISQTAIGYSAAESAAFLSPITGAPIQVIPWGNAGLAVLTSGAVYQGQSGGVFLIDGAAVNTNAQPDATSGTAVDGYASLTSLTPNAASITSGEVQVTIKGSNFAPDSAACWSCEGGQTRLLPTTYVSPTQLNVSIPMVDVMTTQPLEISVYDESSALFSTNSLIFTILPSSSGTTEVTPMNLVGLSMAWDQKSQLLYVGTADTDPAYPNSVVAVNPSTGAVANSATVETEPTFVSDSADGKFLYVGYLYATNLTQLALPSLNTTFTAPLQSFNGVVYVPGDLKASPQDPNLVAATLIYPGSSPAATGGIALYEGGVLLPDWLQGWAEGQTVPAMYDTLAWSASDQSLAAAPSAWDDGDTGPLYELQANTSGVTYVGQSSSTFNTGGGYLHSDFGTGLVYSDGGSAANPSAGTIVGSYGASGLLAPDSTLDRVFILGQTSAQAQTNNYTIDSFDEQAFTPVSSITLTNIFGVPIQMVRWGRDGLAVLTSGSTPGTSNYGSGMLYLIQDSTFVSTANAQTSTGIPATDRVQMRWKPMTARSAATRAHSSK